MSNKTYQAKVFEITYDDPTILKDGRWCAYVNFRIVGVNERDVHNRLIYAQVCSPSYLENPVETDPTDPKTVVLDFLDKEYLKSFVNKIVDSLNEQNIQSWDAYYAKLENYFDIDD